LRATYVFSDKEDELETVPDNESAENPAAENQIAEPLRTEAEPLPTEPPQPLSAEEALKIMWENSKPDINNLIRISSTSRQMSYGLVIGVTNSNFLKMTRDGISRVEDNYLKNEYYRTTSSNKLEIISFEAGRYDEYTYPTAEKNAGLPIDESAKINEEYKKRYGDEIKFASISPDNSLAFAIMEKRPAISNLENGVIIDDLIVYPSSFDIPVSIFWVKNDEASRKDFELFTPPETFAEIDNNPTIYFYSGGAEPRLYKKTTLSRCYKYAWYSGVGKFLVTSKYLMSEKPGILDYPYSSAYKIEFETFENPNNSTMISKVNAFFSDMAASFINNKGMMEIDEETFTSYRHPGPDPYSTASEGFKTYRNDENGIGLTFNSYTGSSNSWGERGFYNFNKSGDFISLGDIFSVSEDIYVDAYIENVEAYRSHGGEFFKRYGALNAEELKNYFKNVHPEEFSSESENKTIQTNFILLDGYLMEFLKFGPYKELTSAGNTFIVLEIPLTMLNDILSDEYAIK
jgi:hypothetical protein